MEPQPCPVRHKQKHALIVYMHFRFRTLIQPTRHNQPDAVLEVFPMPLSTEIPVTKHSGVFFVFPTVAFSQGVFVGLKIAKKSADYEKFIAALEISSGLEDSESLKDAKKRASQVHHAVEKTAAGVKYAGKKL